MKPLTAETAETAEAKTLRILGVLCELCVQASRFFTGSSGLRNAGLKPRATFVKTALADRTWAASTGGRETTDQFECRARLEVVRL